MGNCCSTPPAVKEGAPFQIDSGAKFKLIDESEDGNDEGRLSSSNVPQTPHNVAEMVQSPKLRSFTFNELRVATRNFRPDSVLGQGGFGSVFKGWIDEHTHAPAKPGSGMVVAVKKLDKEGTQGHREWMAEVNFLGKLSHPNLLKLIGFCLEDDNHLLIYEFMPRGSLENHLFRRGSHFQPLSWSLRMKIALGAAQGLAYLHSDEAKVIYRDFKTSNVLLDANYNAKLSDFGLAKLGPIGDESHVSTRIIGTYGYAAPEYLATGHLTIKNDVYSFGVVLVELLSGLRAIDKKRPTGEQNLIEWAWPFLTNKRKIYRAMDSRLEGKYSHKGAQKVALIALECLSTIASLRPALDEVVSVLVEVQEPEDIVNSPRSGRMSTASKELVNCCQPKSSDTDRFLDRICK